MSFSVSIHHETPEQTIVTPVGAIMAATAPELAATIDSLMNESPRSLVIDLEQVPMIDSTGLGEFVKIKRRLETEKLSFGIIHVQPAVAKVFEIVRLAGQLHVFSNREELDEYLLSIQQKIIDENK